MTRPIRVLAINGSLRNKSFNGMALREAIALAPEGMTIDVYDGLGDVPPFNQDQAAAGLVPVLALKQAVRNADAILLCTPEYNHSIPGVLKNALDWASYPASTDNALAGKPVAIIGASPSPVGTARAQEHLRQVLGFADMKVVNKPEVLISLAATRFNDEGRLVDEFALQLIAQLLANLQALARQTAQEA